MKRTWVSMGAMLCFTAAVACEEKKAAPEAPGKQAVEDKAGQNVAKKVEDAAHEASGGVFQKDLGKKTCDILTPALVAKTLGVEEANLKQLKIMGCIYSLKKKTEGEDFEARVTTLMVHKSTEAATTWFKNATKSVSKEQADKQMDEVTSQTKEREEIDTKTKKKTVGLMGELMKDATGKEGIQYESVKGVGDEARANVADGSVWVRAKNLTFVVGAYKGPSQPKPDLAGVGIKEMAKVAMKANREWLRETASDRKAAALRLGQAFVDALPD